MLVQGGGCGQQEGERHGIGTITICFVLFTPILKGNNGLSSSHPLSRHPLLGQIYSGKDVASPPHPRLQADIRIAVPTQAQVSRGHDLSTLLARVPGLEASCMSVSAALRLSSFSPT